MAPKAKSRTYGGLLTLGILILFAVFYVFQNYGTVSVFTPTPVIAVATSTPVVSETRGNSNSAIVVYFTDPVHPFNDVTSGGIENNLITLINQATVSIDAAVYEFDLENVAQALIAARARGITVRMVYDDEYANPAQIKEIAAAGIPAIPDNRSAFMHSKFFVIDHTIVWTGSFNITVNAAYKNNENAIVFRSRELAENYTNEFDKMFSGVFGPDKTSDTPHPEIQVNGIVVKNYFAPEDNVMNHVIEAVNSAKTSIDFMAFSFTDDDLGQMMIDRKKAGVLVQGIFETRGASADSSECKRLLNADIDVRLDGNPYTLHDKVIIIDESTVITGSFNFSANANESNDENLLIIYDPKIAKQYMDEFHTLYDMSNTPTGDVCKN